MQKKYTVKNIIYFFISLVLISLSVVVLVKSNLGTGAADAMAGGISKRTGIDFGMCVNIVALILVLVASIIRWSYPRIQCLITSFIIGFMITFIQYLNIVRIDSNSSMTIRIIGLIVGFLLLGIGTSGYIVTGLPVSAIDDIMLAIKERLNSNFFVAKLTLDGVTTMIAFFLGGPIGAGTLLVFLLLGYVIDLFYPIHKNIHNKLLRIENE